MKYKNPSLSVQERVNDLLPRMTLEEKIAQCIQIYIPPDHPREIVERIRAVGLGSRILGAVSLAGNVSQRTAGIEDLNEIQRIAMNEFRLGIPVIHGLDVIHGLRVIFPIPLGLAATFDPDAIQKTYNIAAEECSRLGFTGVLLRCWILLTIHAGGESWRDLVKIHTWEQKWLWLP